MKEKITKVDYAENDNEVLSLYLHDINKIPLISYEEEYELAVKAKAGDMKAREKLINANLRFVVSEAKKYRGHGIPLSDLINEGNIGLITAIDKFDPEKGYHFISYAVWWILQSIKKALSEKSRAVRLPLNRANELLNIQSAQRELMGTMETSEPTIEDIAAKTGYDKDLVRDLLQITADMVSFDSPVKRGDESDTTFGEFMEDENAGPEEELINSSLKTDVRSLLDVLSDKERDIIELRYGLNGDKPKSLKQIGESYGLTKERIRQIEKRALLKLKEEGEEREMDCYSFAM